MQVEDRIIFQPRPHRDWEKYTGQTGKIIHHTTDGFYRIIWDQPNLDPSFFNLEHVFDSADLKVINET